MNIAHEINAGYDRNNDKSNTNVLISRAQVNSLDHLLQKVNIANDYTK
jgi:hypothetical protein